MSDKRTLIDLCEVGKEAASDGLVTDDENMVLSLQLHDYRLQAGYEILVRLQMRERNN